MLFNNLSLLNRIKYTVEFTVWQLILAMLAVPAIGAEQIHFSFGPIEQTISVEAVSDFGETGDVSSTLKYLLQLFPQEQQENFRQALVYRVPLNSTDVSRFLDTYQGKSVLTELGQIIRSEAGNSGFFSLRAALVLAANEPDGLTLLNVLRKIPVDGIRLDLETVFELFQAWKSFIHTQNMALDILETSYSNSLDDKALITLKDIEEIQNLGLYNWKTKEITSKSGVIATVYLQEHVVETNTKIIILSHGLGGNRDSFQYLAEFLASHGFTIIVPEHSLLQNLPGLPVSVQNNPDTIKGFLANADWMKSIDPQNFVQRPLEITELLNYLTELQQLGEIDQQLDLKNVGIIGQSFGAYTALALAGASFDWDGLREACPPAFKDFNGSLLLQCQAMSLEDSAPLLTDSRIKSIFIINPMGSTIFGSSGMSSLTTPTFILGGMDDFVTPVATEQIEPFLWMSNKERYLGLARGTTHFTYISHTTDSVTALPTKQLGEWKDKIMGQTPRASQEHLKSLTLAFSMTYLGKDDSYQKFLSPAFANILSNQNPELELSIYRP